MSKQTAVDKFHDGIIDLLCNTSVNSNTVAMLWIECKAIEREQHFETYNQGLNSNFQKFEEYYEQTYGKEASHEA